MPRIAILTHLRDRFAETPYTIHGIAADWVRKGIEVEVVQGPRAGRPADLALLHVDLTEVPAEYLALAASYPKCLNRHTPDISKRTYSQLLVRPGDGYCGPVIVKSNHNSGGWMEAMKTRPRPGQMSHAVFQDYPIYEHPGLVPPWVYSSRAVVVEKFLPERDGDSFCTRLWLFFGSKEIIYRLCAHEPIVKSANTARRERITEVPESIRVKRAELGFDYGKFDFGIVDGVPVLYDANRTPGFGSLTEQQAAERTDVLADGVWDYLNGG